MLEVLSLVPPGTLAERVAAVADIAREALVEQALGAADGSRREAAKLLSTAKETVAESRVTEAVRRYPWLGRAYKVARGRRPAQKGEPSTTAGAPSSPGTAAANARSIRRSTTGDQNR